MKKQIIIFFLFLIHFSSWSQKVIKTDIPCNDELLFKTPGRWLTAYGGLLDNGSEYVWGRFVRLTWDSSNDVVCEIFQMGDIPIRFEFQQVKKTKKNETHHGKYDPGGLWLAKRK